MQAISDLPLKVAVRVKVEGDCWVWTGARQGSGHGTIAVDGATALVHRVVYLHVAGEIPTGLIIHHECHNPPCVRPEHLRAITRSQHTAEHGLAGAAKVHAAKETCINGHPFDYHNGSQRVCIICRRKISRESARRLRAARV